MDTEELKRLQEIIFDGCGYCLLSPEDRDEVVAKLEAAQRNAIPDGYVVVPVAQIKEARRIVAKAYADGNSASIRHYNCMTALDRLVDWKEGEECILPDEPIKVMILEGDGMKRDLKKLLAAKDHNDLPIR